MVIVPEPGINSVKGKQVLLVGPDLALTAWPRLEPLLEESREYWELYYTLESIQQALIAGTIQAWLMNDSKEFQLGMLTELTRFPTGVHQVHILWLGGKNLKDALCFADYFEYWCSKVGASEIRAYARKGLERVLKPLGYEVKQIVLVKNIKIKMES